MSRDAGTPRREPHGPPALVAGELRGYRRFQLSGGALHPTVHTISGPWSPDVEQARCAVGGAHTPPATDCGCGLYAWYHPDDARADSGFGNVTAVIAGQGRVILGEHGFRAQAARVEAIALPRHVGIAVVAQHYPRATIYRTRSEMLLEHPPHDLTALGISTHPSSASQYRKTSFTVWAIGVTALYSLILLPRGTATHAPTPVWLGALTAFLLWQAVLVILVAQSSTPSASTPRARRQPQHGQGGREPVK